MITAGIVLYKTKETDLKTVLDCVFDSEIDILYIIDNSPYDYAKTIIDKYRTDRFKYIFGQGNIGFGEANNIAIKEAIKLKARYHIVLNPDITFKPEVITELTNVCDSHPEIGQILPKVLYPDGSLQYLCKHTPTPFDIFARRLLPKKWFIKRNDSYEMRYTGYDKIWNCPMLSGCFMFLNLDIIKKVGLFDSRFFMYFEDNDLTRRLHEVSKTIYYPLVSIIHNHAAEHRHNKKLLLISIKSAIKYFNKWGWFFDRKRRIANKNSFVPNFEL